jgi:hypothetical protein
MITMNYLQKFFNSNTGNVIDKWEHYFEIYEKWFSKYRDTPVTILEIGVYQGGSLNMWKNYFGEKAKIYAIDINPECKKFETEDIRIFIGSQEDRNFLNQVKSELPQIDILIDDGGHTMQQQIVSFQELYGKIAPDGIYLCEDLHTSYWGNYGGGYREKDSFIEYSKHFIDHINAWNSREDDFRVNEFTRSTYALHYYPSILVVEKRSMEKPTSRRTGKFEIPAKEFPAPNLRRSFIKKVNRRLSKWRRKFLEISDFN